MKSNIIQFDIWKCFCRMIIIKPLIFALFLVVMAVFIKLLQRNFSLRDLSSSSTRVENLGTLINNCSINKLNFVDKLSLMKSKFCLIKINAQMVFWTRFSYILWIVILPDRAYIDVICQNVTHLEQCYDYTAGNMNGQKCQWSGQNSIYLEVSASGFAHKTISDASKLTARKISCG